MYFSNLSWLVSETDALSRPWESRVNVGLVVLNLPRASCDTSPRTAGA